MPKKDDPRMMATLRSFNAAMSARLELPETVDDEVTDTFLALTGAVANEVVRPAAPFAGLFAGYLVGAGRADSLEEAAVMVADAMRSVEYKRPIDEAPAGDEPAAGASAGTTASS